MFTFGNDLIVYKEDSKNQSNVQERNGVFDYGKEKNVLIGKMGTFDIKRIRVVQME